MTSHLSEKTVTLLETALESNAAAKEIADLLEADSGGGTGGTGTGSPQELYVDATVGNDLTGNGSVLAPFASIPAALAVVVPSSPTVIRLGPGNYSGDPIAWPADVSIRGAGGGTSNINHSITYTAPAGEHNVGFNDVSIGSQVICDLTAASVGFIVFQDCGVNISRIGGGGPGANVFLYNCFVGGMDIGNTVLMSNCLFTSSGNNVNAGGQLLLNNCVVGVPIDIYGTGYLGLSACTFPGTIEGHTVGLDTPTLQSDASSLASVASIVNVNIVDTDDSMYTHYDPQVPSDWNVVPTQTKQALDSLAAELVSVKTLQTTVTLQPADIATLDSYPGITLVSASGLTTGQAIVPLMVEFYIGSSSTPYTVAGADLFLNYAGNYSGGQVFPADDTPNNGNVGLLSQNTRDIYRAIQISANDTTTVMQADLLLMANGSITGGDGVLKVRTTYKILTHP